MGTTRMAGRAEVIACFRQLHRTRAKIFHGDSATLAAAREKINSEFRKYNKISNSDTIAQLVKFGNQAEEILRTSVIQAKPKDESTLGKQNFATFVFQNSLIYFHYTELKINKETSMFDN